jgi:hypothetical protein
VGCLVALACAGGGIAVFVFCIIALVRDWDLDDRCVRRVSWCGIRPAGSLRRYMPLNCAVRLSWCVVVCTRCANSHLRDYLLSSLCVSTAVSCITTICTAANKAKGKKPTWPMALSLCVNIAYTIWGYIEAFDKACSGARHKLLWDMVIVVASLNAFAIAFQLLAVFCAAMLLARCVPDAVCVVPSGSAGLHRAA